MFFNSDVHQNGCAVRLEADDGSDGNAVPRAVPGWYDHGKVLMDVSLALIMLIISAPVILLACLAVKLTSRGPMLYCQTRVGRGGKPYTIFKIRTMTHECERNSGVCWAKPNDPRVTFVGRLLRRVHIDELPQLWNVARGDMSLVGPRPERPEFVPNLIHNIARYRERLYVRPGVTGLAQIQLPADTNLDSVRRKLAYDVYYVEHMSLGLDCRILLSTVIYVLGLPVSLSQMLFGLPSGEPVERAFLKPPSESTPLPELNPV